MLGFIDDLFDIRWRHKLPIPLIASVPMLLVYYSEGGLTSVVLPRIAERWLESLGLGSQRVIDLGERNTRKTTADLTRPAVLPVPHHAADLYNQLNQYPGGDQWR